MHTMTTPLKVNWKNAISQRTTELPESNFEEILRIAAEDKSVLSLGPGEPDFGTPKPLIAYAKKMLDKGYTHYSAVGGRQELKEAIAKKVKKENGIQLEDAEQEVIVTAGSTEAILLGLMTNVDPKEEVLVPNPGFLTYIPTVELINGIATEYSLKEETGFQIDLDELKKKTTKKTRALILNSPSNPTGTVYKKKVLEEIADIAVENNLIVFSDEAYEKLVYDGAKHVSFGSLNGMHEFTLTLQTFSKSYAMPGFRLGYAVGHRDIIQKMAKIHLYTSLSAPTLSQVVGVKAIQSGNKYSEKMRKEYARRRKLILKRIEEIPSLHIEIQPEGAFYAFPRMTCKNEVSSKRFAEYMLKEAKVLVVPGNEFGSNGEGFIRLSYATQHEKIEQALDRIEKASKPICEI